VLHVKIQTKLNDAYKNSGNEDFYCTTDAINGSVARFNDDQQSASEIYYVTALYKDGNSFACENMF
jgi:hypothetical protein